MPGRAHRLTLLLACAVLLLSPGAAMADETDWNTRYDRLVAADAQSKGDSTHARAAAITASYDALFPAPAADQISTLSAQDAALGFRAANMAHFYSLDEHHLAQMRVYFDRLTRLNVASPSQVRDMSGAYVASRHWQQARSLREAFPAVMLAPIPSVLDAMERQAGAPASVLTVGAADGTLARVPEDITRGPVIIAVSHPLCHFSRAAFEALASDPALATIKAHIRWIAPVDRELHLDVLQQWNTEHPEAVMKIAYSRSQWPPLDSWGTPTFYFLKDGKLLKKVEGWPEGGRKPELLEAAHAIGL